MKFLSLSTIIIILLFAGNVKATEYTSSSFKVLDPVIDIAAGPRAATTSYALLTALGQPAIGRSTSATFGLLSGFLYFFEPVPAPPPAPPPPPPPPPSLGGGPLFPPITYFPPFTPLFPPLLPPFIPPVIPLPPPVVPPGCVPGENGISRADLNCDGRVNLVDFSVFMYFLPRPIEVSKLVDITKDETVDLIDLSVMFSEWTERVVAFVNGGDVLETAGKEERAEGIERLKEIFSKGKGILEQATKEFSREKYETVAGGVGVVKGETPLPVSVNRFWYLLVMGGLAVLSVIILAVRLKLKNKS